MCVRRSAGFLSSLSPWRRCYCRSVLSNVCVSISWFPVQFLLFYLLCVLVFAPVSLADTENIISPFHLSESGNFDPLSSLVSCSSRDNLSAILRDCLRVSCAGTAESAAEEHV